MGYKILHAHGYAAPKGKRSYITLGNTYKTKEAAKKFAKKNLTGGTYKYVPTTKVKKTKQKELYYIK